MVIAGAPSYLEAAGIPKTPEDLLNHSCLALRFASGGLYAWELKKGKRELQVRVEGQAIFNGSYQILNAAVSGCGLAFVPEDMAAPHVDAGRLRYVMEDWYPTIPGLHAYYTSSRQRSRAVQLVIDALRSQT
jgi:DNA-binding transcriptional LysR family regulator